MKRTQKEYYDKSSRELKESKFMLEDHLQVHNQKDQPHDSSIDLMVLTLSYSMLKVARICFDFDTNSLRMSLEL